MFPASCSRTQATLIGRQIYRPQQLARRNPSQSTRSVSVSAKTKELTTPDEEDDLLSSLTKRRGGRKNKGGAKVSPREWLNSEEGRRFRDPVIGGTNWLGDEIPFPTNPWFKPKPPLWDGVRTKVYESFKNRVNSIPPNQPELSVAEAKTREQLLIRQTSEQWGISKERVAAIIRLKALEESWTITTESSQTAAVGSNRTLQLNFEKGMENVLGVDRSLSKQVEEDVNELANRKLMRKSKFYGFEFVPLDSPVPVSLKSQDTSTDSPSGSQTARRRYEEQDVPSTERQIRAKDGVPRPPPCYISAPPDKIPMVFTDVSEFPRQAKPISKRKAKHFPRTSLLPNHSEWNAPPRSRSNCTLAAMSVRMADGEVAYPTGTQKLAQNKSLSDEQKEVVSDLLRRFKGCSTSDAGMKMLDEFKLESSESNSQLDHDLIKEMVLLRAGGLSFRKSMGTWDADLSISAQTSEPASPVPEDEKQIQSMKYQMIKSIYKRKLELNQAGRLLLPKMVRAKQEKDFSILHNQASKVQSEDEATKIVPSSTKLRRGDRLLRRCMKGPAGRMKQRELLAAKAAEV
ncbi:hypothetical protein CROQUDRAFT_47859 [Cronartium quercuum f. sp. fusiforme G11]|uniref:Uncharacterized protein n=1 Tax=Cronartium quercuum f. sp. fusiforme G11 TaxID=708437 RepID=A0A9P6NH84_9BASI|nr:hypothetical protein CROQUDRAFT_47859 [Cronartium quercuum f. sp. fusiforme G11]